jgi:hypothetical protein
MPTGALINSIKLFYAIIGATGNNLLECRFYTRKYDDIGGTLISTTQFTDTGGVGVSVDISVPPSLYVLQGYDYYLVFLGILNPSSKYIQGIRFSYTL